MGEVALLVDDGTPIEAGCEKYTGSDVVITEERSFSFEIVGGWCYGVRCSDGVELEVAESSLRKRRPPQDWVKLCNLTDLPREVFHV